MAGIMLHATSGEIQLPGTGVTKTILQIVAAANDRIRVQGWGVFIKGTSATDVPVLIQVARQTTAGTGGITSQGSLAKKNDGDPETIQTTIQEGPVAAAWGAEPTTTTVIESAEVHPQTGYRVFYPMGQEVMIPNGERLGFRANSATIAYACTVEADIEE